MSTAQAQDYRRKADDYAKIAGQTRSLKEASNYRKMARAYAALADEEDWLDGETRTSVPRSSS
jgi:hypothetical protein